MNAQYLEAINMKPIKFKDKSLFLAGGISGCGDWQKMAVEYLEDLEITIVNPRRNDFNMNNMLNSVDQIKWEHKYLWEVSHVMFWFPDATLCPITLFELGKCLMRNKLQPGVQELYIGCSSDYKRVFDVEIQSMLLDYHRPIFKALPPLLTFIKSELH